MRLLPEGNESFNGGMQDSSPANKFRSNEVALLLNGRVTPDGAVRSRGGSKRTHAGALAGQGYGAIEFRPTGGAVQWVVFAGGSMYTSTDEGVTWTQRASLLRQDYWSLAIMQIGANQTLLCANGGANIHTWDGTTWGTLAAPAGETGPPAGVKFLALFNSRLYVAGHNGNVVQASKIGEPAIFTMPPGLYLPVQTHEGDNEITGLFTEGENLLVFKRESTSAINGFGVTDLVVAAGQTGVSRSVGCVGFRTIRAVGDQGVMWLSERGLEWLRRGRGIELASKGLTRFFREDVAWGEIADSRGIPVALHLPDEQEYVCYVPTATQRNDYGIVFHLAHGACALDRPGALSAGTLYVDADGSLSFSAQPDRSKVRLLNGALALADAGRPGLSVDVVGGALTIVQPAHTPSAFTIADRTLEQNTPVSVGYDGFVRVHGEDIQRDDLLANETGGAEIGFHLRSRPFLFGSAFARKRARTVEVLATAEEAAALDVALVADGVPQRAHRRSLSITQGRAPKRERLFVKGTGRTLQAEVRNTSGPGWELAGIAVGAERLRGL